MASVTCYIVCIPNDDEVVEADPDELDEHLTRWKAQVVIRHHYLVVCHEASHGASVVPEDYISIITWYMRQINY